MRILLPTTLLTVLALVSGCAAGPKEYDPSGGKRTIFLPVVRQNAPEPVYNRLRWVHPPEVLPERDLRGAEAEAFASALPMRPVYQMSFKDTGLQDVSRILAATARYDAFCDPVIANQKLSMNDLGTIDELAQIISERAGITVEVNHETRTVRLAERGLHLPRLTE